MVNEVINNTEESTNIETSVNEQTITENSGAETSEEASSTQDAQHDAQTVSDESQSSSEMDFGAILQEFEQEQTIYHSGELVEGKIVGISDRGVLVDFGYKSEGIIDIEEFTSPDGEINVKKGDDVEVVIRSIHSGDAPPLLSRMDALNRKAWDVIETAFNDEVPIMGFVIDKTKGGLRVDLNGVEAFLPGSQVDSRPIRNLDSFKGQEIETRIIKFSRKRNNIVLSRKALTDEVINKHKAETLGQIEEGYIVDGTVKNLTEYGAFVDIGGIDGLLHVTDMSWGRLLNPNEQFKVNDNIQVKVLKLDREKEKVSLGFKQLLSDPWSTVMEVYPLDSKVSGKVSSVTDYGAFIELEPGVEGLVHVSEMSWSKRSKSPRKLLNPDEEVEVQVLGIDTNERRISLGMKQLQVNPWETIGQRYRVGSTVKGKVRNLTDFGAFVELEEGVDGLVHISDISWSKKIKHPKDVLRKDQEVEAVVTSIDTQGHRLSLSIKELTPSVWEIFITSHRVGDVVKGKVSRFAGFGVFVQLGEELEGLCHISELSDERVEKPEDVVSIGQEMDFKILRIEHDVQKIGLSARAVGKEEESPIDTKSYSSEAKGGMTSLGELMNLKRGGGTPVEDKTKEESKLSKKERKALKAEEKALNEDFGEDFDDEDLSDSIDDSFEAVDSDTSFDSAEAVESDAGDNQNDSASTQNENIEIKDEDNVESSNENAIAADENNTVNQSQTSDTTDSDDTSESENSVTVNSRDEKAETAEENSLTNAATAESSESVQTKAETALVEDHDSTNSSDSETASSESSSENPDEKTANS
ncbi:MAG: 30S ribosomal protein S1 [Pyrinomonadaceae bacterium]